MKKIILNHKSYLSIGEIKNYINDFPKILKENMDVVVFPNILYLSLFEDFCTEVGCQNFYSETYGDYTGEINLEALKELDIKYTMISHKDRINNLLDNESELREKLNKSLNNGFKTLLVVGEEKMTNDPFKYIKGNLNYLLKNINKDNLNNLSIIYEPIWSSDVQDINTIRKVIIDIKEYFISYYKKDIEVYYGLDNTPNNINEILEFCDGICIGRDSINIDILKEVFDNIS